MTDENTQPQEEEMTDGYSGLRSGEFVFRSAEGEAGILEGKMLPYNEWARIDSFIEGQFYERFLPRSIAKSLSERMHKIRVLFEHGVDSTVGRAPIAEFEDFRDEEDGVYYRAKLLPSVPPLIRDGLSRGLYGSSIRHRPLQGKALRRPGKSDYNPEGWEERSISEAMVREFSVVSFPAYEGATAVMRSLTDDYWKLEVAQRAIEHPELLLEHLRAQAEDTTPSAPEAEAPPEETTSRDPRPKPKKDWLSTKEQSPWLIP